MTMYRREFKKKRQKRNHAQRRDHRKSRKFN